MTTKAKSWWDRLVEKLLRQPVEQKLGEPLPPRPAVKQSANDLALRDAREDDPVYRALMDQAYKLAGDNLAKALDPQTAPEEQRLWLQRAGGLRDFIGNIEHTRATLQQERERREQREALKAGK